MEEEHHPSEVEVGARRRKVGQRSSPSVVQREEDVDDRPTRVETGEFIELIPQDDSPYPEVRASVPNTDNPAMPQNTVRMWVIGLTMTTFGCGLNLLFSLRDPVFQITPFVSALLAWPLGKIWERFIPVDARVLGVRLNPGPFNLKEHGLITIMANVSFGTGAAYLTDVVIAMRHFYSTVDFGWGFQVVAIMASQAIGFSMAGLVRRVLIYPAAMIWPGNLVTSTLLTNIHLNVNHVANGWRISRLRFFSLVLVFSGLWSFFVHFVFPALSHFAIGPWIAPGNVVINQLFGTQHGLAYLPLSFDWNQIAGYIGSPLIPPYFAVANVFACVLIVFWIGAPIIQYANGWYGKYLPMSSLELFDRFQQPYEVRKVIGENMELDVEKYMEYSPVYMPVVYALSYAVSFAAITATVVHTALYDGKDLLYYWRHSRAEPDDVHMRLIRRYREVPDWWFASTFVVFLAMAIAAVRAWDTQLPVWALLVALGLALFLLVPVGLIYALTNITMGLNVVTEFIIGYMVPGKPVAMMMFKTFGFITSSQAVAFLQDMKLGHYLKIAPRLLFMAQLIATIWGAIVQLAVMNWTQGHVPDLCTRDQPDGFTCPAGRVFFNASIVWGVIGPQRVFDKLYRVTLYGFLVGAILPVITWLWVRHRPRSLLRLIHWPVFFNSVGGLPPATLYNYTTYFVVGHVFGYWVKRTWFNWWAKYNYTLSAGLDLGLALGSIVIFFLMLSPHVKIPTWWGQWDGGAFNNADNKQTPFIQLAAGESFGPSTWA
ncbi:hypothetical protein TRICI_003634 [Trichomonascus ciferrii]|uniref:OPT family small oligopeptide transporter n=1 Tax=Trichomonascus ciferrii TaxID=44093 RepID=A0A642V4H4_9ASCO|nr:hypothetical protein TRICI_003634 [Trichomonascus ciferrii]